jgi:hypothetical protein
VGIDRDGSATEHHLDELGKVARRAERQLSRLKPAFRGDAHDFITFVGLQ